LGNGEINGKIILEDPKACIRKARNKWLIIMSVKPQRNVELDCVKGLLVILMVVYHCASMESYQNSDLSILASSIISYLDFISRAFILVSGFLCGVYYLPQLPQDPKKIRLRLAKRGFKLIVICLIINLVLYSIKNILPLTNFGNLTKPSSDLISFLFGFHPGDTFAFEVIYYIGILLLIASVLLNRLNFVYPLLLIFIINYYQNPVIWGLTYGFVGIAAGSFWEDEKFKHVVKFINNIKYFPVIVILFTAFLLLFTKLITNVPSSLFIFEVTFFFIKILLISASFIYILKAINSQKLNYIFVLFGQYTLFAYLIQMIIIRLNFIILIKYINSFTYIYIINLLISTIYLYYIIYLLDKLWMKKPFIKKTYNVVFN
jgi:fucose 4-O-acetylase-like acetyltransferase